MSEAEVDFDQIGSNVLRELARRLEIPAAREGLPGTLLMKLAADYMRILDKRQVAGNDKDENVLTAMEIIDQEGISDEHKYGIMSEYLDTLEAEWRQASDVFEKLHAQLHPKEEEDGRGTDELPAASDGPHVPVHDERRDGSEEGGADHEE